ncbi:aminomethyl-transferring glycine dehydrogenase subunit GcvPB [Ruminococcaceae bacterium OttesenSCG-928-I18]|nr:aminomethyl-transferring glycine dehydrogenase subunit GcvPB [Ruminococcaceae bacterium OttesenSCG-928-I18]
MKLIFEKSKPGRGTAMLPPCDVPFAEMDESLKRKAPLPLPEIGEGELARHYSELERRTHGVNNGFYPLGSCTMKYNPHLNEDIAMMVGFNRIHPLQPERTAQGCLGIIHLAEKLYCEITGMDAITFQPSAGAHGEFTGIAMIRAYHQKNGEDEQRREILIPDAAHGTNPASAAMNGYKVVTIPSGPDGCTNMEAFRSAVGPKTAGVMLTNPNTLGIFEKNIAEITDLVHTAGGLCYYDGANLNAVMGIVNPGAMGFDIIHLNLHKTFSTPHGGGGPGSGAVGCKEILRPFLPVPIVSETKNGYTLEYNRPDSIGKVRSFYGNFLVVVRALCYILSLGSDGVKEASEGAVLNANYLRKKIADGKYVAYKEPSMHEFVLGLSELKKETGISALDIAKGLLDYGIHPPTMYFPLIVEEALMVEPTETETRETLDEAAEAFNTLFRMAKEEPEKLHGAPFTTPVKRPDEVEAARHPILRYQFD